MGFTASLNTKIALAGLVAASALSILSMGTLGYILYYPVSIFLKNFDAPAQWTGDWVWPTTIWVGLLWSFGFVLAGVLTYFLLKASGGRYITYMTYPIFLWIWAYFLWYLFLSYYSSAIVPLANHSALSRYLNKPLVLTETCYLRRIPDDEVDKFKDKELVKVNPYYIDNDSLQKEKILKGEAITISEFVGYKRGGRTRIFAFGRYVNQEDLSSEFQYEWELSFSRPGLVQAPWQHSNDVNVPWEE